jgi:hypothetical protein
VIDRFLDFPLFDRVKSSFLDARETTISILGGATPVRDRSGIQSLKRSPEQYLSPSFPSDPSAARPATPARQLFPHPSRRDHLFFFLFFIF